MEVNLERVVRFYHVAEGLSFVKAARRMNVDQTWLSRQIQQLETQLDCRLLERSTRHVSLTAEGEEFFEVARELVDAARKVRTVAGSLGTQRRRELTLGISDTTFWVPEQQHLIEMAATRHPELTINTVVRSGSELWQKLREREIDVCIAGISSDMEHLDHVTIHRSRPSLLIPEENPLAGVGEIHMADLAGVEFAVPMIGNKIGFQQVYQPFIDAGAVPHWVSEGPLAAMHYAAAKRLCLVAWGFNIVAHGFALRSVEDCSALLQVVAARNEGDDREAVRKFWASPLLVARQIDISHPELRGLDWDHERSAAFG